MGPVLAVKDDEVGECLVGEGRLAEEEVEFFETGIRFSVHSEQALVAV